MKWLACVMFIALGVACGNKQSPPDPDIDRYVNTDLAPHLAAILHARAGYGDVRAADVEDDAKVAYLRWRLRESVVPLLDRALAGTASLSPPEKAKDFHADLLAVLKAERDPLAEMAGALDPLDAERFKAGHARMMEMSERVFRWEQRFERLLMQHGVKLKPLPKIDLPEPKVNSPSP